MKLKKYIITIVIIVVAMFSWPDLIKAGNNPIEYFFQRKFQTLKVKNKLKIITIKSYDYFEMPLHDCLPGFYRDLKGANGYYLEDHEKINKIGVEEYVFKDTVAANKAYQIAYGYAESVRKIKRKDFAKRCFSMPTPQIYYASKDGSHVYLYTESYNFMFYHSGEDSVDTNMQNDKRILLDDIYREMSESK